jgi:hypothetical protein
MADDLHVARVAAKRLERYSHLVKDKIWSADHRLLIDALADCAEAHEIARRLYGYLEKLIKNHRSNDG